MGAICCSNKVAADVDSDTESESPPVGVVVVRAPSRNSSTRKSKNSSTRKSSIGTSIDQKEKDTLSLTPTRSILSNESRIDQRRNSIKRVQSEKFENLVELKVGVEGSDQSIFVEPGSPKHVFRSEPSHLGGGGMMTKLALKFPAIKKSWKHLWVSFMKRSVSNVQRESVSRPRRSFTDTVVVLPPPSSSGNNNNTEKGISTERKSSNNSVHSSLTNHTKTDKEKYFVVLTKQLVEICNSLGTKHKFSAQDINGIFNVDIIDPEKQNESISFNDFMLKICMNYFLLHDKNSGDRENDVMFNEIRRGFDVVKDTFELMDTDNSGEVQLEELKQALFSSMYGTNDEILEIRFKELDLNGDGDIEFPEFLFCLISWIGMDEEELEEEADGMRRASGLPSLEEEEAIESVE